MNYPFFSGCLKVYQELVGVYRSKLIFSEIAILSQVHNFLRGRINIQREIKDLPRKLIRTRLKKNYLNVLSYGLKRNSQFILSLYAEHV